MLMKDVGFSEQASEKFVERKMFRLLVPETSMVSKKSQKKRSQKNQETSATMQLAIVPETPVESRKQRKKRSRTSEECASVNDESSCLEEAEVSTLKKKQTVSTAAALEPSKHSKAKLGAAQIQDLQLTAKNLIRSFEEIDLVSSSDTESILSIDDDEISEGVTFEPATLVWATIKGFPMWPSQVVDLQTVCDKKVLKGGKEGQILVYFFGKHKFGWQSKSQLKLFFEHEIAAFKGCKTKNFRKALCEAKVEFENMHGAISQQINSSSIPHQIAAAPTALVLAVEGNAEPQIGKQKKKISVKAGKRQSKEVKVILKFKKPTSASPQLDISMGEDPQNKLVNPVQLGQNVLAEKSAGERLQRKEMRAKNKKLQKKSIATKSQNSTFDCEDEAKRAFVVTILLLCASVRESHGTKQNDMRQAVLTKLQTTVHKYESGDGYKPVTVNNPTSILMLPWE